MTQDRLNSQENGLNVDPPQNTKDRCVLLQYYCRVYTSDRQVWCFSDVKGCTYSHEKGLNLDRLPEH